MTSTINDSTTENGQTIDWFDMMETEFFRCRDAGLDHNAALIASFDTVRFRREIAGQSIRLEVTPAEPIPDVDGTPLAVTEAVYEKTEFLADALGQLEPAWISDPR